MKRELAVGDMVTIVGPNGRQYTDGIYWNPRMSCLIGKIGIVNYHSDNICFLNLPNRSTYDQSDRNWMFHVKWLKPYVDSKEDEIEASDINELW